MTKIPKWGGRRAAQWTAAVLARGGDRCMLQLDDGCTQVATTGDHIIPRSVDLSRQYDVTNGRPACLHCNQVRGTLTIDPVIVDPLGLLRPRLGPDGLLGGLSSSGPTPPSDE